MLKGSDDIYDYDLRMTRIEGETCLYFAALINADGVDGFTTVSYTHLDVYKRQSYDNSAEYCVRLREFK